jgi:hypothetical protein
VLTANTTVVRGTEGLVIGRPRTTSAVGGRHNATVAFGGSPKSGLRGDDNARRGADDWRVSAADLHHRLRLLELERLEAREIGLIDCQLYRRDLEEEMAQCRAAYVGAAVTEIATLRAELSGPQVG